VTWISRYAGASRAMDAAVKIGGVGQVSAWQRTMTRRPPHPARRYDGLFLVPVIAALGVASLAAHGGPSHPPTAAIGPVTAPPHAGTQPTVTWSSAPDVVVTVPVPSPTPTTTTAAPAAPATTPGLPKPPRDANPSAPATTPPTQPPSPAATPAKQCSIALAYLAAHAKPGYAHYCRPGPLNIGIAHAVSYTCMPGTTVGCPDGGPEIVIADPSCAASYKDEASNSYWNFSSSNGVITPGAVQDGRTWDPYGECP